MHVTVLPSAKEVMLFPSGQAESQATLESANAELVHKIEQKSVIRIFFILTPSNPNLLIDIVVGVLEYFPQTIKGCLNK